MKLSKLAVLVSLSFLSFSASSMPSMGNPNSNNTEQVKLAPEGTVLPMIAIKINCGDCTVSDSVQSLIASVYLKQAELGRTSVNQEQNVEYNINAFKERTSGARLILGRLAGSDKIDGELVCNQVKIPIGDSGSSGFYSIEDAAKSVGKSLYQAILECVLPKADTKSNQ